MTSIEYPVPLASIRHRLGGKAVDLALSLVTLNIGWLIWSFVVWGQGQTPGKQILKLRVYDKTTGKPAKWGHMAIRELGLPLAGFFLAAFSIPNLFFRSVRLEALNFGWIPLSFIIFLTILLSSIVLIVVYIVDPLWIFRRGKRNRLTDIILKTDVLNESPDPR